MAWFAVHQEMFGQKLKELAQLIGCSENEATGMLVRLWSWGIDNSNEKGRMGSVSLDVLAEVISQGMDNRFIPVVAVRAMLDTGWINIINGELYLNDWDRQQADRFWVTNRREREAERLRRRRRGLTGDNGKSNPKEEPPEEPMEEPQEPIVLPRHSIPEIYIPEPEPEQEPIPDPEPIPEPEPVPAPIQEPEPAPEPVVEQPKHEEPTQAPQNAPEYEEVETILMDGWGPVEPKKKPKKAKSGDYGLEFETWWEAYPRRIDKGNAYKKYMTRRNDGWSEEDLLAAARNYAAECARNHTAQMYIKHPKTFLSDATPFTDYIPKKERRNKDMEGDFINPFQEFEEG